MQQEIETTCLAEGASAVKSDMKDTLACQTKEALDSCASFAETLAAFYFEPLRQDQIDALAERGLEAFRGLNEDFDRGINDITRCLRRRNTGTRQQLACDFTSAFVGTKTWEGKSAVPYESVFTSEDGLLCQGSYHDVVRAFRNEGLRKDDGLNIPDDHISYLLQFVAVLTRRAGEAVATGDSANARHDLDTARTFMSEHILSWFDEFNARACLLIETRFYRGVLSMTKGFLTFLYDFESRIAQTCCSQDADQARTSGGDTCLVETMAPVANVTEGDGVIPDVVAADIDTCASRARA